MILAPATTHGKRGLGLRRPVALLGGGEEVEEGGDAAEGVERVAGRLAWGNQQAVLRPLEASSTVVLYKLCPPPEGIVGVCAGLAGHHLPHVPGGAWGGGGGGKGSVGDCSCGRGRGCRPGRREASPGWTEVVLAVQAPHLQLGYLNSS